MYVLEVADWNLNGLSPNQIEDRLEDLLESLDAAGLANESIWIGSHLNTAKVYTDKTIWEIFDPSLGLSLPRGILQELSGYLNPTEYYDNNEPRWPPGFDELQQVHVENQEVFNLDVLWAVCWIRSRVACACLGLGSEKVTSVRIENFTANVHWIWSNSSKLSFWRAAIQVHGDSPATLQELSIKAYPKLYFNERVWRGCNRLDGGYLAHAEELQRYLAAFNDHGHWVFKGAPPEINVTNNPVYNEVTPSAQIIEERFANLTLIVTPEKPNVAEFNYCREPRTFTLGDEELYCHWHGKIQPHRNRIYIHPPTKSSKDKLIIGFIEDHLPLPGDR